MKSLLLISLGLLSTLFATAAYATNGYFQHGYGIKSQGMGGVGIALPQSSLAAATNPAGMVWVGNRMDVGLVWFRPIRQATIHGSAAGPMINGTYDANDTKNFFLPSFGYNRLVSDNVSWGISIYGNGGMDTDFNQRIPLFGSRKVQMDLQQVFIAPTVSWKITPNQSFGIAANFAYQRFKIAGLQNFDNPMYSADPGHVTNNGRDSSYGAGIHLGWLGNLTDYITLGLTWQSKTYMTEFDKYSGLFANQGDFDIPATYGAGITVHATDALTLSADVQRILYSDVDAVGNDSLSNLKARHQLGADNGPGFGWRDVTAYKLGISYKVNNALTLRTGYDHSSQPIARHQTLLNVLAPGVVQDHATLGVTWTFENGSELSLSYMHAFEQEVEGRHSIFPGPPAMGGMMGGEADLQMYQDSLGIGYSWAL